VEYAIVFPPDPPASHTGGDHGINTVPVTGVPFCTPLGLTAYTLKMYNKFPDSPVYACVVVFAPETLTPLTGVTPPVVGL
jgi:hypothetical protein